MTVKGCKIPRNHEPKKRKEISYGVHSKKAGAKIAKLPSKITCKNS